MRPSGGTLQTALNLMLNRKQYKSKVRIIIMYVRMYVCIYLRVQRLSINVVIIP